VADRSQPGSPDDDPDHGDYAPAPDWIPGLPLGPGGFDFSRVDLAQVMRMLQSTGPVNWEIARQMAEWVALEGTAEPIVERDAYERFDELSRAAQTLVVGETGLASTFATPLQTVGPKGWIELHLVALRPVLEALAATLGEAMRAAGGAVTDHPSFGQSFGGLGEPSGVPLGGMVGALAPVLLGVQAGSMVGYLAQHALGRYDLPLPTGPKPTPTAPGGDEPSLCFVVPNIDTVESEWSLPRDDLRFYLALHEVVRAAERSVPWVRSKLVAASIDYVSSYRLDPAKLEEEFGRLDPSDPASLEAITGDPERVLGAMQTAEQARPSEELQRLTAVMEGYADHVMERIGRRLIPTFDQIHEAAQRHRLERGEAGRFIESLLGLKLEREHYDQGAAFCRGVFERADTEGLNRLWDREAMLPTRSELEAPGLWLARIELPD